MPKLYSSKRIIQILEDNDFFFVSQKGSHVKFRKELPNKLLTVIVPDNRREIPMGTFRSILRQSQLNLSHFT